MSIANLHNRILVTGEGQTSSDTSSELSRFYLLMIVATFFPLVLLLLTRNTLTQFEPIQNFESFFIFFVNGHTTFTLYFFADKRSYDIIKGHKWFYIGLPVLTIVVTALSYGFLPDQYIYLPSFIYHAWLLYHYMRQNYGILSLIGKASNTGPVSFLENAILKVGAFAGILAFFKHHRIYANSPLAGYTDTLFLTGEVMYGFVLVLLFAVFIMNRNYLKSIERIGALLVSSLFFLPAFIFNDPIVATASFGLGHGLQYIVILNYFALKENEKLNYGRLVKMYMIVPAGLIGVLFLGDIEFWSKNATWVIGVFYGLTMSHFIIDSDMWKLSKEPQKKMIKGSLNFLYK